MKQCIECKAKIAEHADFCDENCIRKYKVRVSRV